MIPTTFEGESVYLLPYSPNWDKAPSASFSLVNETVRSLGGREARRSFGHTLRTRLSFSLILGPDAQAAFRVGLQRLENKRVLVPFWPAAHLYYSTGGLVYLSPDGSIYTSPTGELYTASTGETPPLFSGIWLTFEPGFSAYEVHTTDTPTGLTPSSNAVRVPLMIGIFENAPDPQPLTSNLLSCAIKFKETSSAAYALRAPDVADESGPALPYGFTPAIFPLRPDWGRKGGAGAVFRDISRADIGFGRSPAETYYPQPGSRLITAGFTSFGWASLSKLVAFFHARQGTVESFWVSGLFDEVALASPSTTSSADIVVTKASDLGDNPFVALIPYNGAAPVLRKVIAVNTGTNTITLDSSPGDFAPTAVRIVSLVLARFTKPELSISFETDRLTMVDIGFTETANEYTAPAGETVGLTMGGTTRKAYLFRFHRFFPGGTLTERFTSYERTIAANSEVFEAKPISHTEIEDSLEIERSKVAIKSRAFEGNPLMLFVPFRLEVPLWVEILECEPNAEGIAGIPTLTFVGKVGNPKLRGPDIECDAIHQLQELQQPVPTMLIQPTCNYQLYEPTTCGVVEAAYTSTGTVSSTTSGTITLASSSVDRPAGWFAFGRVWFGSGATYQTRTIYDATACVGGVVTLTISHAFNPAPSGTLSFSPGCPGDYAACGTKFGNAARFGGFPFVPPGNPSLVPVKKAETAGGKK